MKKPIHKRWWFWVIIVVVGLGLIGSCSNSDMVEKEEYQKLEAKIKLKNKEISELKGELSDSENSLDRLRDEKDSIQSKLDVYEEKETEIAKKEATKLLDSAEKTLNTADFDKAKDYIEQNEFLTTALFSDQIDSIQEKIDKKEADLKKKAEQAAEAKKKAAESEVPDDDQKVAESPPTKQTPNSGAQPKQAEPTPKASETVSTVFVAPQSGKKYHYSSTCRGLNHANSVKSMGKSEAIASGYSLCGWED